MLLLLSRRLPHLDGTLDGVQRLRAAVPVRGLDEPGRQSGYGRRRGDGGGGGGGARRWRRRPAAEQTCGPRSACLGSHTALGQSNIASDCDNGRQRNILASDACQRGQVDRRPHWRWCRSARYLPPMIFPTAPSTGRSADRACNGAEAAEFGVGAWCCPCRRVIATGGVFAWTPAAMAHSSRTHAADRAILSGPAGP